MPPAAPIPSIRDGVFFTHPGALPRGKHRLPREEVVAIQRERVMIAAVELLAAHGYRGTAARDVCVRAGVSLTAFYENFADRDQMLFTAYDRFIDVLLARLVGVSGAGSTWGAYVEEVIGAYFETLASDLVVARAFQVEMDAMGRPARARRRAALTGLADLLRTKHLEWDPMAGDRIPAAAYLTGVYGSRQAASDALDVEPADDEATRARLRVVQGDAVDWVTRLFGD
ncbi:TetR/AcrR family transcriptional regulator [Nocardioides sp.]|uniref:TetR/AcrR family transcriptional regulator n=1 Tax=Nocardioides sp. TaxID=35761 RepID=UPI003515582E